MKNGDVGLGMFSKNWNILEYIARERNENISRSPKFCNNHTQISDIFLLEGLSTFYCCRRFCTNLHVFINLTLYAPCIILTDNYSNQQIHIKRQKPQMT